MVKTRMRLQGNRLTLMKPDVTWGRPRGGEVAYGGKFKQQFSKSKSETGKLVVGEIEFLNYGAQTKSRVPVLKKVYSVSDN